MARYLLLGLALAASCGGPAAPATPIPTAGRFAFANPISGSSSFDRFEGVFELVADTVLLEVSGAYCTPRPGTLEQLSYRCAKGDDRDEVRVTFERRNPAQRAKAYATVRTPTTRSICVRYETSASGQRTCAQYSTETVYVSKTQTLFLRPEPVP
jgi:hypothetical protein